MLSKKVVLERKKRDNEKKRPFINDSKSTPTKRRKGHDGSYNERSRGGTRDNPPPDTRKRK